MYEFVTGPLAWLSFAIFFIGVIVRTVLYIRGLDWKLDRVTYSVNTSYGVKGAVRSIVYWLFPWATRSYRNNSWFTLWVFVMHIGLLLTPVFLLGHNILLRERLGCLPVHGLGSPTLTSASTTCTPMRRREWSHRRQLASLPLPP